MKNYTYMTLLTNDSYINGVALLSETLKKVNSQFPLKVLINSNVSAPVIEILNQLCLDYELINDIEFPSAIMQHNMTINPQLCATWRYCCNKFHIFNQIQFDKIIFLDADIMILRNIDHLFDKPHMTSALDGEYFNLWPDWPHFNTGILVIEPSEELFLNILSFMYSMQDFPDYVLADQEILNLYFKDWPRHKHLHLNKYYDIFPPYIYASTLEDIKKNCYFIHFTGRKPWNNIIKNPVENYEEYFYEIAEQVINDIFYKLDFQKILPYIKLSVYAICKNEKQYIEKWIKCFSKADYLCILDTGSTDGTWEYLQEVKNNYTNLIIDQKEIVPWRFDTARNESLKLVPKDTVIYFMVDLDELILKDDWVQKIKYSWVPAFSRGSYTYYRDILPNGTIQKTMQEYRIHNKDWYKYINIVHECLVDYSEQPNFLISEVSPIDIEVYHYKDITTRNKQQYSQLCEQELQEHPDNVLMRLQLAIEYEIEQNFKKAYEQFNLLIVEYYDRLQPFELARCYYGIGLYYKEQKKYDIALMHFSEGRIIAPYYPDNYIGSAEIYSALDQNENIIEVLERGFKFCQPLFWCSVCNIKSWVSYFLIGMAYCNIGEEIKGFGYLCYAELLEPNNKEINRVKNEVVEYLKNKKN